MTTKDLVRALQDRADLPDEGLSDEQIDARVETLESWIEGAHQLAEEEDISLQDAAEKHASEMSEEQLQAARELHAALAPLLIHTIDQERKIDSSQLELDELQGISWWILLRALLTYDPSQGTLPGLIQTRSKAWARRYIREIDAGGRLRGSQSERLRRQVRRALSAMEEPSTEEIVEYAVERSHWLRENCPDPRKKVEHALADIRSEERSLDDAPDGERDGTSDVRTLGDIIADDSSAAVDIRRIGRSIAEQTNREALFERLLDEEPTTRSFSHAKAREILLEREARDAELEQIAWEHDTSAWVVEQIEDLYDLSINEEDVERYAIAQGYEEQEEQTNSNAPTDEEVEEEDVSSTSGGHDRALTPDEIEKARQRYREGETQKSIAADMDVSNVTISEIVRGVGPYDEYEEIDTSPNSTALTPKEAEKARERYLEGEKQRSIAAGMDVTHSVITDAVRGRGAYDHFDAIDEDERAVERNLSLSEEDVLDIRERYREGETLAEIAEDMGVSHTTISEARRGVGAYSHLDPDPVTESPEEDTSMDTKSDLQAQVDRLTTIIERAAQDLPRSDAKEIREHYDELDLTREQLEGVHEISAVTVETVLMGLDYDEMTDLTRGEDHGSES